MQFGADSPRSAREPARKTLNIYSDRSFVPPGKHHVPMLDPFWRTDRKVSRGDFADPFDRYIEAGRDFFQLTPLQDADLAILPAAWPHFEANAEYRELANRFVENAHAAGKRTAVFFNSDSTSEVPLPHSLIFRTSMYRSQRRPNEFAMPAWSEDFVEQYLDGKLPVRPKKPRPVVGFCGLATPLVRSWARNSARWAAGLVGLRRGSVNPFARPGHAVRLRAMRELRRTSALSTNFVLRDTFFGASGPAAQRAVRRKQQRREYVQNIVDSDYTLCVRGAGNFSYRLYETLSCGRIPVFVDTDCVLPYESAIDWRKYCVYVDAGEVSRIGDKVVEFHSRLAESEFEELQRACRQVWEDFLSPLGFFRNFYRHLSEV